MDLNLIGLRSETLLINIPVNSGWQKEGFFNQAVLNDKNTFTTRLLLMVIHRVFRLILDLFHLKCQLIPIKSEKGDWNWVKIKKVGSITYLFSLKLTNLTKPKLMKKNVLQIYAFEFKNSENNR